MIDTQLTRRRNKASEGGGALPQSQWLQTQRWWYSQEGQLYWYGPPCPRPGLLGEGLYSTTRRSIIVEHIMTLMWGRPTLEQVVLKVPIQEVARFALKAAKWNLDRQAPGHRCR